MRGYDKTAKKAGPNALEWRKQLQDLVVVSLGQVRSKERLTNGLLDLAKIEDQFSEVNNSGTTLRKQFENLRLSYETRNLIAVARMLGTSGLQRKETRGGHFRIDYPEVDNKNFLGNYVVWKKGGQCHVELRPVPKKNNIAPPPRGDHSTGFDPM